MNLVPEWAPNVHPLVVHFPIALLFVAVLVDAVALAVHRRYPSVRYTAVGLYVLGAVATLVAFFTGRSAADGLDLPTTAVAAVGAHADWALWTVWAFGLYGLVRLGSVFWDGGGRLAVHLPLFLLGMAGLVLVFETAERGARLVFDLGVGVRAAEAVEADPFASADKQSSAGQSSTGEHAGMTAEEMAAMEAPTLQTTAEGAWRWPANVSALPQGLRFVEGSADALGVEAASDGLALRSSGPILFTAGEALEGVEVRSTLDLAGFMGRAALVHHVQDARNYDFLAVEKAAEGGGRVVQGRVRDGQAEVFDESALDAGALDGPVDLRAVAYGTHFRGYLGGELVAHGHGDAAPAGRAGLLLDGTGPLRLLRLEAVPVSE